jgi:small-conductance mechanosensitive channel
VKANQDAIDAANQAIGPLRAKLEALQEELVLLEAVDRREQESARRARQVEANIKSSEAASKAAAAAKEAEIKRRADAWDAEEKRRKDVVAGMVEDAEKVSAAEKARIARLKAIGALESDLAHNAARAEKMATDASDEALLARRAVVEDRAKHFDTLQGTMTDSASAGFTQRLAQIREEDAAWTTFGTNLANVATTDLSGGVVGALDQIRLGSKTAGAAFRDFAADTMFQVARLAAQMALLRALMSAVGVIAGGVSGGNPAGLSAAGNASQVSQSVGPGGVPNIELKSMKLAPDVNVHLTVRPPAVIADDVAAKASPEAKAALVASAIRRPGRRGARAGA